jgi:hypothetical protein
LLATLLAAILVPQAQPRAPQDLFTLQLSVQAGADERATDGVARPVLTVKTGARLRVRWSAINQQKTGALRDVTMHVVVDKENAIGQQAVKPGPDVVYESALVMDFAPQAKSSGDFIIDAPAPGAYLVRVETIGTTQAHAASIDLQVIP